VMLRFVLYRWSFAHRPTRTKGRREFSAGDRAGRAVIEHWSL